MAVEPSISIGANIEDLREFERIFSIHTQSSSDKNEHTTLDWTLLNILIINLVLNGLEAERLDFLFDFLESSENTAIVCHDTVFTIEIEEVFFVLHDGSVVSLKELLRN